MNINVAQTPTLENVWWGGKIAGRSRVPRGVDWQKKAHANESNQWERWGKFKETSVQAGGCHRAKRRGQERSRIGKLWLKERGCKRSKTVGAGGKRTICKSLRTERTGESEPCTGGEGGSTLTLLVKRNAR